MISISHMKTLSKAKPTRVWCLDLLGENLIEFDRLSLCSQIKAIPIEDVVAMLTELQQEIKNLEPPKSYQNEYTDAYSGAIAMKEKDIGIIQSGIDKLRGEQI